MTRAEVNKPCATGEKLRGLPDEVGRQTPRKTRHRGEITGLKTRHYRDLRQGRAELAGGEGVEGAAA
jgi:hypothetical protein